MSDEFPMRACGKRHKGLCPVERFPRRPIDGRLQIFPADEPNILTLAQQAALVQIAAETVDANVKRQALRLLELAEHPAHLVIAEHVEDPVAMALDTLREISCPEHRSFTANHDGSRVCPVSGCDWKMSWDEMAAALDRARTTPDASGMYRHSSRDGD